MTVSARTQPQEPPACTIIVLQWTVECLIMLVVNLRPKAIPNFELALPKRRQQRR